MIQTKKKTKRKITIEGLKYKVDYKVYKIIDTLEQQLSHHTLALYNYIEIYNFRENPTKMETVLYNYAMQLPHAELVEEEVKKAKEDEPEDND